MTYSCQLYQSDGRRSSRLFSSEELNIGGLRRDMKRAHRAAQQTGRQPIIFLRVSVGWTEIPHSRVWLGTRKSGSSWASSWHTDEVVLRNLKALNQRTMTSTNMFQGLDTGSKPSSRWGKIWSPSLDVHEKELRTRSCFCSSRPVKLSSYCSVTNVKCFCTLIFGRSCYA